MKNKRYKKSESGIALLTTLLGLMVLSAIGAGLIFMTNTESMVNYNYRSEQVAYFGAKAGMEEARDRMMVTSPNSINGILPVNPPSSGGGVLYIMNEGNAPGTVQPWTSGNAFMDDELCHDGYNMSGLQTGVSPDIRCTSVPSGGGWYQTINSTLPWNGTNAALPYKWTRIALKLNGSNQGFPVNPSASLTSQVCWNGSTEVVLPASKPNCQSMTPTTTPVYLVTSLAVGSTGARKMVQADVAVTPSQPSGLYGLFATGVGCSVVGLAGGAFVDSWDSANGGTYQATKSSTGGNVGGNGNVNLSGGSQVGGNIGAQNTAQGACPAGITLNGNGNGLIAGQNPPNTYVAISPPVNLPTPPPPVPPPPTTNLMINNSQTLVPGTYGDLKVGAGSTLTLAPGVYNLNSITLVGNSVLTISPPGQVTLNITGSGVNNPVDLSGGTLANTTGVPNNFQINYGGTGGVKVSGGAGSYLVVDAPNAPVSFTGGSDIFGAVVGNSITDQGGTNFHVDTSARVGLIPPSGNYVLVSFRHVAY